MRCLRSQFFQLGEFYLNRSPLRQSFPFFQMRRRASNAVASPIKILMPISANPGSCAVVAKSKLAEVQLVISSEILGLNKKFTNREPLRHFPRSSFNRVPGLSVPSFVPLASCGCAISGGQTRGSPFLFDALSNRSADRNQVTHRRRRGALGADSEDGSGNRNRGGVSFQCRGAQQIWANRLPAAAATPTPRFIRMPVSQP